MTAASRSRTVVSRSTTYSGDEAAGDAAGDGIGGKWFIAPVDESAASQGEEPSATPYNRRST